MPHTFEELATRELDGLYQGALFLSGGREGDAESLLVSALARSFHLYGTVDAEDDLGRWLEGKLVATHMTRAPDQEAIRPSDPGSRPGSFDARVFEELDARGLNRAAGSVPHAARAALWLVLLRRWSYDDAAGVMKVDRETLADLLRFRHTLVSAVLGRNGPGVRRRKAGA